MTAPSWASYLESIQVETRVRCATGPPLDLDSGWDVDRPAGRSDPEVHPGVDPAQPHPDQQPISGAGNPDDVHGKAGKRSREVGRGGAHEILGCGSQVGLDRLRSTVGAHGNHDALSGLERELPGGGLCSSQ